VLAYYVPEAENKPANVVLVEVPSYKEVQKKFGKSN